MAWPLKALSRTSRLSQRRNSGPDPAFAPCLPRGLLATRLLSTPLARRPELVLRGDERILALLADLHEHHALALHRAFTAWLLGYLLVELRAMDDAPDEPDPAFRIGLHRISAQQLPHLRATATGLTERGGPETLAERLDALLDRFG